MAGGEGKKNFCEKNQENIGKWIDLKKLKKKNQGKRKNK